MQTKKETETAVWRLAVLNKVLSIDYSKKDIDIPVYEQKERENFIGKKTAELYKFLDSTRAFDGLELLNVTGMSIILCQSKTGNIYVLGPASMKSPFSGVFGSNIGLFGFRGREKNSWPSYEKRANLMALDYQFSLQPAECTVVEAYYYDSLTPFRGDLILYIKSQLDEIANEVLDKFVPK